jgi:hypothetical protein
MMLMQQIDLLKSEANRAFRKMERLAPTGREDCAFEEAFWQLAKVGDSVKGMYAALDDFMYEAKIAMASLDKVGEVIESKIENPYLQIEFVFPQESRCHAYT